MRGNHSFLLLHIKECTVTSFHGNEMASITSPNIFACYGAMAFFVRRESLFLTYTIMCVISRVSPL